MKNVPNILSVFRMFAAIAVLTLMLIIDPAQHRLTFVLLPGIIFGIGCLTDMLDGKIARKYNLVSDFGKFVDPIADKVLTFFAMLGFIYVGVDKSFPFMLIAVAVTLFREFVVSTVRMLSAQKGIVVAANIYGKLKTLFQMSALIGYFLFIETKFIIIPQVLMCIAVIMTILSGCIYLLDYVKLIKRA